MNLSIISVSRESQSCVFFLSLSQSCVFWLRSARSCVFVCFLHGVVSRSSPLLRSCVFLVFWHGVVSPWHRRANVVSELVVSFLFFCTELCLLTRRSGESSTSHSMRKRKSPFSRCWVWSVSSGAEEANTKAEANASPQQLPNPHVPQHLLTRTLARTPPRRLLARTAPICLRTAPMPLLRLLTSRADAAAAPAQATACAAHWGSSPMTSIAHSRCCRSNTGHCLCCALGLIPDDFDRVQPLLPLRHRPLPMPRTGAHPR